MGGNHQAHHLWFAVEYFLDCLEDLHAREQCNSDTSGHHLAFEYNQRATDIDIHVNFHGCLLPPVLLEIL